MGWRATDSTNKERLFETPEQDFVIVAAQILNRKLHAVYTWGQSRGDRFPGIVIRKNVDRARTRDLDYILSCPRLNRRELAEKKEVSASFIKEATGVIQLYLNTTLIHYHHRQYYQGWWLHTSFTRNPVVLNTLTDIYTIGEETKEKAREIRGESVVNLK
jgi:hypothetical protein